MELIAERGRPVTLDAVRSGRRLGAGAVLVTFDDAYRDFASTAWPIMRSLGIRPVLFVPTAFPDAPGRSFWWDRLHRALAGAAAGDADHPATQPSVEISFKRYRDELKAMPHQEAMERVDELVGGLGVEDDAVCDPVLGWSELRRLAAEGVDLAPHTRTHPLLERVDDERLREELGGSREDLLERCGIGSDVFAYPSGSNDRRVRAAVAAAGFRLAFTTEVGVARVGTADPLRLPRLNVGARSTPTVLGARIAIRRRVRARRPYSERNG
ncbi:MAG: polysaccharide deacetylase family protein [Acidimicrobiia bacterium]